MLGPAYPWMGGDLQPQLHDPSMDSDDLNGPASPHEAVHHPHHHFDEKMLENPRVRFEDVNKHLVPSGPAEESCGAPLKPSSRSGGLAFVAGDETYFYGGLHNDSDMMNDMWAYHPGKRQWREVATRGDLPEGSFGGNGTVLHDGTFFLLSGQAFQRMPLGQVHHFNPATGVWTKAVLMVATLQDEVRAPVLRDIFRWGSALVPLPRVWWPKLIGRQFAGRACDVMLLMAGDGAFMHRDTLVLWRALQEPYTWHANMLNFGPNEFATRRRPATALYREEFVFLFGGRNETAFHDDLWIYSVGANTWVNIYKHIDPQLLVQLFSFPMKNITNPAERETRLTLQKGVIAAINAARYSTNAMPYPRPKWPSTRTGHVGFMQRDEFVIATGFTMTVGGETVRTFNDVWSFSIHTGRWVEIKPHLDIPIHARQQMCEAAGECLGPTPHSMSAFTVLPGANNITRFMLHGGRQGEYSLEEAIIVDVAAPPPVNLSEICRRWLVAAKMRELLESELHPSTPNSKLGRRNPLQRGGRLLSSSSSRPDELRGATVIAAISEAVRDVNTHLPRGRRVNAADDIGPIEG